MGQTPGSAAGLAAASTRYKPEKAALVVVFCVSFASLWYEAGHVGLASGFIDPVAYIDAQDEALYAHSAIRMAEKGGWLTPMFLGRYGLYKPPLLMWLAGLSARIFGVSPLALRLPVVLASSLTACLVFAWLARTLSWMAAGAGVLLLLSNHLWHELGRMCLTDGLLAAAIAGAAFCLLDDPRLERRSRFLAFASLTAAAILAKSVAGILPLLMLLVTRPPLRRCLQLGVVIALLAGPWFAYQLVVHPRWFWTEHFGVEILTYGVVSPQQTSQENQVLFYAKRLFLTDPVLTIACLLALPWWRGKRLLAAWIAMVLGTAVLWQYRNAAYLLPAIPALSILAADGPLFRGRWSVVGLALLAGALLLKVQHAAAPWGVPFASGTTIASAPLLDGYARRGRPNELILVEPDDAFYATLLPLPAMRYCYLTAGVEPRREKLDFRDLGIMVTAAQFLELDKWRPLFLRRLREWGLDSAAPIATVVLADSADEIARVVTARPQSDFFLPEKFRAAIAPRAQATHDFVRGSTDWFFLLAKRAAGKQPRP